MMEQCIKTAFCVSYDWNMLKYSLPRVYDASDVICLGIDKYRRTWKGVTYDFDEAEFRSFVAAIDTDRKIIVYEDDFFVPGQNSRANGNLHRTKMAERLGKGGWHLQIDADEYMLDFEGFVQFLKNIHPCPTGSEKPLNVTVNWIPLIKKLPGGYLYVDFGADLPENVPVATNVPSYLSARRNDHFNMVSPYYMLHETWSRADEDLWFKISNWGHASEELKEEAFRLSYFKMWQVLDQFNCWAVKNFHPANPALWPSLSFVKGDSVSELLQNFQSPNFPLSGWRLFLKNNRNIARLKSLLNR